MIDADRVAVGHLDRPWDGEIVIGDVVTVTGWCVFPESTVARVEVVMSGGVRTLARLFIPAKRQPSKCADRDAAFSRFEAHVMVNGLRPGATGLVAVEAISLDGRRWRSQTRRVRIRPRSNRRTPESCPAPSRRVPSTPTLPSRLNGHYSFCVFAHDLEIAGAELWLLDVLRAIAEERGVRCTVASFSDGPLREPIEALGMGVRILDHTSLSGRIPYEAGSRAIAALLREVEADAVLANTLVTFQAIDAASREGIPTMWAIHESYEPEMWCHLFWGPGGRRNYVRQRFYASLAASKAMIFEARQTSDLFAEHSARDRRFILHYGVDIDAIDDYRSRADREKLRERAGFAKDDILLLCVGRMETRKNQAGVLAAFDELAAVHPHLRLVIVGDDTRTYSRCVREQLSRYASADRVHLIPVSRDIYPWYAMSDLLVSASDIESLPRSMLEAMAFSLPIISTEAFGVQDLLTDGLTGWLTRPRDFEGLVGLLHYVLRLPPDEWQAVASRARSVVLERCSEPTAGRRLGMALKVLARDPSANLASILSGPVPVSV
jgi:D-inositol-3-phosphate glycosyltransferase